MLDRKFVVENLELVATNCRQRNVPVDLHAFAELERQRRACLQQVESLNRQANEVAPRSGRPPTRRNASGGSRRAASFANGKRRHNANTTGWISSWSTWNRTCRM